MPSSTPPPGLVIDASVADLGAPHIAYACPLNAYTLLCAGPLAHELAREDTLTFAGQAAQKSYLGTALQENGQRLVLLLLTFEAGLPHAGGEGITIARGKTQHLWPFATAHSYDKEAAGFEGWVDTFSPTNRRRILWLLLRFLFLNPAGGGAHFARLCFALRQRMSEDGAATQLAWLLPDILCQHYQLRDAPEEGTQLVITTPTSIYAAGLEATALPSAAGAYGALSLFDKNTWQKMEGGQLTLFSASKISFPGGIVPAATPTEGAAIALLESMGDLARQKLREHIAATLRRHVARIGKAPVAALLSQMQLYVPHTYTSVLQKEHPFGMNVEYAVPLAQKTLFISGWLRDPLQQVARLAAISDLGFTLDILPYLQRHKRSYVDTLYANSPYAKSRGAWGFVAEVPIPKDILASLAGLAEMRHFRFEVTLKDGLAYSLSPRKLAYDPFALRDALLTYTAPHTAADEKSDALTRKALATLHAECMQQVRVSQRVDFLSRPKKPPLSIIIPLYRTLDFLKMQIAHFAQDEFLRTCEILYVLDSPEQEEELTDAFKDLTTLYKLPLSLLVMERPSGYAASTNAGAAVARAPHLLLLNSDVLPLAHGWAEAMLKYYQRTPKIGALGPKLLYGDGSLQHAGMYFAPNDTLCHQPVFENRHYYKGYPRNYAPARKSREVPAVTGACLMISTAAFRKAGGLSTDYIIGDFEDSDLCLALAAAGLKNHYCAEVELTHFERQSTKRNEAFTGGNATRYNALRHAEKWGKDIQKLMKRYAKN